MVNLLNRAGRGGSTGFSASGKQEANQMPGSHKVLVLIKIATLIAAGWLISGPALAEKAQPPAASGPAPAELPAALFE